MTELQYPLATLTDRQRDLVREFYAQNPKGGYKSALAHAGVHVTKAVAKAMIEADDDLDDLPYQALRVDRQTALAAIGDILNDPEHKDRLRAALASLAMLYGLSEKQSLELTGAEGGPLEVTNPDVAAAVDRFTALADAAVRRTVLDGTDSPPSEPE